MMQGIKETYKKDKQERFEKSGKNQIFVVQAISAGFSSGNFAKIVINDSQVFVDKNESGNYRGLHIVVVNPKDANVEVSKVFDTYMSSDKLEEFIDKQRYPDGYIVVAACKDDCVKNLSKKCKMWFGKMGSTEIWDLCYRQGWAFISMIGLSNPNEKRETVAEAKSVSV